MNEYILGMIVGAIVGIFIVDVFVYYWVVKMRDPLWNLWPLSGFYELRKMAKHINHKPA